MNGLWRSLEVVSQEANADTRNQKAWNASETGFLQANSQTASKWFTFRKFLTH